MYEKHGLMVLLKNPEAILKLRSVDCVTHTEMTETALCKVAHLKPRVFSTKRKCREKEQASEKGFAVKIYDQRLVAYVMAQRKNKGISHRYTVEQAIMRCC